MSHATVPVSLRNLALAFAALALCAGACAAQGAKTYGPGVTDHDITIGQTMPYSGPASAYGAIGRAEVAYFHMINDQGGVNGRKINLTSLDDGYSPPKTLEQTRRLVEQDQVAVIFGSLGTPTNSAIRKYLNERKVPQLFIATGGSQFGDPEHFPWTMPFAPPSYRTEGSIYGKYILQNKPDAKVAVLYQNDDLGKDLLQGLRDGLGAEADKRIVAIASYEVTDPTIQSQIVALHGSGADTLLTAATPKFAAQSVRAVYDIGWKPLHFLDYAGSAVAAVLVPAGLEKAVGIMSTTYLKDPTDPQWKDDPAYKDWLAWMKKYNPEGDIADLYNVVGYTSAMMMVQVLKECGDDLTRDSIMKHAANLHGVTLPMLQPGIVINTSPTDYFPVKQMRPVRFNGQTWAPLGDLIAGG
jgi:branched-chain amino acid transport system substrate-binding protein